MMSAADKKMSQWFDTLFYQLQKNNRAAALFAAAGRSGRTASGFLWSVLFLLVTCVLLYVLYRWATRGYPRWVADLATFSLSRQVEDQPAGRERDLLVKHIRHTLVQSDHDDETTKQAAKAVLDAVEGAASVYRSISASPDERLARAIKDYYAFDRLNTRAFYERLATIKIATGAIRRRHDSHAGNKSDSAIADELEKTDAAQGYPELKTRQAVRAALDRLGKAVRALVDRRLVEMVYLSDDDASNVDQDGPDAVAKAISTSAQRLALVQQVNAAASGRPDWTVRNPLAARVFLTRDVDMVGATSKQELYARLQKAASSWWKQVEDKQCARAYVAAAAFVDAYLGAYKSDIVRSYEQKVVGDEKFFQELWRPYAEDLMVARIGGKIKSTFSGPTRATSFKLFEKRYKALGQHLRVAVKDVFKRFWTSVPVDKPPVLSSDDGQRLTGVPPALPAGS
jgi:hypothetical protein